MKDTWLNIYYNNVLIDRISVKDKVQANDIIQMVDDYIDKQATSFKHGKDAMNDWPRLCLFR